MPTCESCKAQEDPVTPAKKKPGPEDLRSLSPCKCKSADSCTATASAPNRVEADLKSGGTEVSSSTKVVVKGGLAFAGRGKALVPREGFGGRTQRSGACKNCQLERNNRFRNSLCEECERGFRKRNCRAQHLWTPELQNEVATEAREARRVQGIESVRKRMSDSEKLLFDQNTQILELLQKHSSQ